MFKLNKTIRLVVLLVWVVSARAELILSVGTDEAQYSPGDTIEVSLSVFNNSNQEHILYTYITPLLSYYLGEWDSYCFPHNLSHALETVIIPPYDSLSTTLFHDLSEFPLSAGVHDLIPYLPTNNYLLGPPLQIVVSDTNSSSFSWGFVPPVDSLVLMNGGCVPNTIMIHAELIDSVSQKVTIQSVESTWYNVPSCDGESFFETQIYETYYMIRDSSKTYDFKFFIDHDGYHEVMEFDTDQFSWHYGSSSFNLVLVDSGIEVDTLTKSLIEYCTAGTEDLTLPQTFSLETYPNPFNAELNIRFTIPQAGWMSVRIYNLKGILEWETEAFAMTQGERNLKWNGNNSKGEELSSGVYMLQVSTPELIETKRLLLLK